MILDLRTAYQNVWKMDQAERQCSVGLSLSPDMTLPPSMAAESRAEPQGDVVSVLAVPNCKNPQGLTGEKEFLLHSWNSSQGSMEKALLIPTQTTLVMWPGPAQGELALLAGRALWWEMGVLASPETQAPLPAGQCGYTWPCGTEAPGCWNRKWEGWNTFFLLTWPCE